MGMHESPRIVSLSEREYQLMVNGLNSFRSDCIRDKKPTEDINLLLMKVIQAPRKKERRRDGYEAR